MQNSSVIKAEKESERGPQSPSHLCHGQVCWGKGRIWELRGQHCRQGAGGIALSREGGRELELEIAALASSHKGIMDPELNPHHMWDHRRAEEKGK